jgi:hypothetical protein
MLAMIDRLRDLYYQYYNQFMTWYSAADEMTQITVIVISGLAVFVLVGIIFLSKLSK